MRKQKFIAMLLALAMLLPMLPMMAMETSAAVAEDEDVIRLPITIYDFKADGKFMEVNPYTVSGMMEPTLSSDGTPAYSVEAIRNLAERIDSSSDINSISYTELQNLISSLRSANTNSWDDTAADFQPSNQVAELKDARTASQVADWILRNCFKDSSFVYNGKTYEYAKLVPEYDTLVLREGTYDSLATNTKEAYDCYYYNSADDTLFDRYTFTNGNITGGKGEIYNDSTGVDRGNGGYFPLDKGITPYNTSLGFGEGTERTPNNTNYGTKHNYHMSTAGSGQFVYHKEDDLFFAFHGDDDVMVYINGILVIDNSGVHGINKSEIFLESNVMDTRGDHYKVNPTTGINRNTTWAEYLGLQEGELYRFDFFQMERHVTDSNFAMFTNMNVIDSSAVPQKKAYLNGQELQYGAFVPQNSEITYGFTLNNNGSTEIFDVTFEDSLLHVKLNKSNPVIDAEEANQPLTTYDDLEYSLYEIGEVPVFEKLTEDALVNALEEIPGGYALEIRGFKYNVGTPEGNATTKTIPNTLHITAQGPSRNNPEQMVTLQGSAAMRVRTLDVDNVSFVMDYAKTFTMENTDVFGDELLELSKSITVVDEAASGEEITTTTVQLADALNNVTLVDSNGDYGSMELVSAGKGTEGTVEYPKYNLEYTPTRFLNGMDTFLIDIDVTSTTTYEDNSTETSEYSINKAVNIIPANNVYYEDSFVTSADTGVVGIEYSGTWNVTTAPEENTTEKAENDEATTNGGVHGWEDALADDTTYSSEAAHYATEGAKATFTFKGTGVDVYTSTDINSGMVTAKIKSTTTGSNFQTKYLIVDNLAVSGSYKQVPTLSFNNLPYDEYQITLAVNSAKAVEKDANNNIVYDENGNPSYVDGQYRSTYYLDGIRVYNPLGMNISDDVVIDGYLGNDKHDTVQNINTVFKAVNELLTEGAVFIDTAKSDVAIEVEDYTTTSTYKQYAPKNEVYLAEGQSITFKVSGADQYYVGMKSLTGNNVSAAQVTNAEATTIYQIGHTTDLYYKVVPNADGIITILNTETADDVDTILALTKVQAITTTPVGADDDVATVNFLTVEGEEAVNYVSTFTSLKVVQPEDESEEEQPEVPEVDVEINNPEPEEKPVVDTALKTLVKNLFSKILGWFTREVRR